jgi:hypothetical protein
LGKAIARERVWVPVLERATETEMEREREMGRDDEVEVDGDEELADDNLDHEKLTAFDLQSPKGD